MAAPRFAHVPYQHAGPALIGAVRRQVIHASLIVGALATLFFFPFGALLFLVPLAAWLSAPHCLSIGPRYLMLGTEVFYYANAHRVVASQEHGTLHVIGADGAMLLLERKKLQTNARHSAKIERNKAAKFNKVSALIIERVRLLAPDATVMEEP